MEKETYKQQMNCENCGRSFTKDFPMGIPVKGYSICPNCGCKEAKSVGMPKSDLLSNKFPI